MLGIELLNLKGSKLGHADQNGFHRLEACIVVLAKCILVANQEPL